MAERLSEAAARADGARQASVRAAGGVVWRRRPQTATPPADQAATQPADGPELIEILLVHRPKYDDWSLPKGKAEPGESDEQTARREVEEETGIVAALGPELGTIDYIDNKGRPKTVRFWAMGIVAERPWTPNEEVDERAWLAVPEARRRLSYQRELSVLDAFQRTRA